MHDIWMRKLLTIIVLILSRILALAEIFDCDAGELNPARHLDEIGWDSMAMLSVIAMVKTRFNRKVPGSQIREFETVQDVLGVMQAE